MYANGQAVGVTRSSNYASSERSYFGTDLIDTVRSSTTDSGSAEYYEYDVFGKPYGESVSDYAYTGKPYDPTTGMYNYGYRDYVPQIARFTTIDPIRDGSNWFAYCNNEPVNFLDAWGLKCVSDKSSKAEVRNGIATPVGNTFDDMVVTSEWGPDRPSISAQGKTTQIGHNGMDFAAPKGTRVNAVMDGEVTYVDNMGNGDYGKVTIITHSNGQQTLYAHQDEIVVKKGDKVEAGQKIGTVGNTGISTGDHLHLGYDSGDGTFSRTDTSDNPAQLFYTEYYTE